MGTRSLTVIENEDGAEIVVMYRQYDGYPSVHGAALALFLDEKHLVNGEEKKDEAREKAREEARKKLEEQAKSKDPPKPLPEFGSALDFPLEQALNQLKGKPVMVSKTVSERSAALDSPVKK